MPFVLSRNAFSISSLLSTAALRASSGTLPAPKPPFPSCILNGMGERPQVLIIRVLKDKRNVFYSFEKHN